MYKYILASLKYSEKYIEKKIKYKRLLSID